MRTFLALFPPPGLQAGIGQLIDHLRHQQPNAGISWVQPDALHLTLVFLGECPAQIINQIRATLENVYCEAPLSITLEAVKVFPHDRDAHAIVITVVDDPALHRFQSKIRDLVQSVGVSLEDREFRPHISIGRVKQGSFAPITGVITLAPWQPSSMKFIESTINHEGSQYSTIATFPLYEP